MRYKVKQSLQIYLEKDLNEEAEKGYFWVCKLFNWNTDYLGGKQILVTYLVEKK